MRPFARSFRDLLLGLSPYGLVEALGDLGYTPSRSEFPEPHGAYTETWDESPF